jgi:hypothetical protein
MTYLLLLWGMFGTAFAEPDATPALPPDMDEASASGLPDSSDTPESVNEPGIPDSSDTPEGVDEPESEPLQPEPDAPVERPVPTDPGRRARAPVIEPGDPGFVGPATVDDDVPESVPEPWASVPAPLPPAAATAPPAPPPVEPAPPEVSEPGAPDAPAWLPDVRARGVAWAFTLAALAALAWLGARALQPLRNHLADTGILPSAVAGGQTTLRMIAVVLALGVVGAVIPDSMAPTLPVVALAVAAAVGWSTRDLLPDVVAGMVISTERRIRPGQWIATPIGSGVVEHLTLRVTRVRDATGRQISLPNRTLLKQAVMTDQGPWPTMEFELLVPPGHAPSAVRRVIEDAVLVSPWAAPVPAQMIREEQEPGRWRVRARVLESRFSDRFEGGLREHVEEVLESGSRLRE